MTDEPLFTTGDTAPDLTGTVNADLTGAAVELHIKRADATILTVPATITDPTTGAWSYTWAQDDLTGKPGMWKVEAQVTYSTGAVQTFGPQRFTVQAQIA